MTVGEFYEALDGHRWRAERQREQDAWIVAHLLAPHRKGGKPPSIESLLGRNQVKDWDTFDEMVATAGAGPDDDAARREQLERMRAARKAQQG